MTGPHWYANPIWWLVIIYLAPTIICAGRLKLLRLVPVFLLNVFAGWSGIGWIAAMTLATT